MILVHLQKFCESVDGNLQYDIVGLQLTLSSCVYFILNRTVI